MSNSITGSCLCGEVSYKIDPPFRGFTYCHCTRCRKVTGTAHAANLFVSEEQFQWLTGEDKVGRFEHPDAKYFATGFCTKCGSNLPWMIKVGGTIAIPAGTLDEDPHVKPEKSIYWQDRACWFEDTNSIEKFAQTPQK